jgi:hypothetical protein
MLCNIEGEFKNYLVCLNATELLNPYANICAGTRWLSRKKETASEKLKTKTTWIEAIEDYKGFLDKIINKEKYNHRPMGDLNKYYKRLKENNNEKKHNACAIFAEQPLSCISD